MLRAEDEARAAQAHIREAMDLVNLQAVAQTPQKDPIVCAVSYPQFSMLITPRALVFEPGMPQGRQVGQGLSFG